MFKRMFAVLVALVLAAVALPLVQAQDNHPITGSGNVISETRQVSGFTSVELRGVGEVSIVQGDAESLTVTADDNILPMLTSEVVDGVLILSIKPDISIRNSTEIRFDVTMITVESVELSGAGNITAHDIKSDQVDVTLCGAGAITFGGEVGSLSVVLSGAGNVILNGVVENLAIDLSGAGNVDAENLAVTTMDVNLSGFGNVLYEGDAEITVTRTGFGSVGDMPALTIPAIEIPAVTIPEITIPAVEIPAVEIPAIVIPAVTVPSVKIPPTNP